MTDKKLTAQKLHATFRKAGIEKSETYASGRIRGIGTTTYGYEVETDGGVTFVCGWCQKAGGGHVGPDCFSFKPGIRQKWKQRKVTTGTFTVRLNRRTSLVGMDDYRSDRDRVRITEALTEAGIAFTKDEDRDVWHVTGYEEG